MSSSSHPLLNLFISAIIMTYCLVLEIAVCSELHVCVHACVQSVSVRMYTYVGAFVKSKGQYQVSLLVDCSPYHFFFLRQGR